MGCCVLQCGIQHQWIAQRQVGPVSVYCDGLGCHVLCLPHGIPVWQYISPKTKVVNMPAVLLRDVVTPKNKASGVVGSALSVLRSPFSIYSLSHQCASHNIFWLIGTPKIAIGIKLLQENASEIFEELCLNML